MNDVKEITPTREQIEEALADVPESNEEVLTGLTSDEKLIVGRVIVPLTAKIRAEAQAEAARTLATHLEEIKSNNKRMMEAEVEKFRASLKPPDPDEIETLLSQDYGTMQVCVGREGKKREFVLRELPQAREKELFSIIQKRIVPKLKELAAIEWANVNSRAEQMQKVLEIVPDGLDVLAAACAICLDPHKEDGVTAEWVQENLGSNRIMSIVDAQMTISKVRDFGSAVYRLLPS